MSELAEIGILILRCSIGGVYLYALYLNVRDQAARQWTIDHTAYLFPRVWRTSRPELIRFVALAGMLTMLAGGLSLVFGVEGRIGALMLMAFTIAGIYQHERERQIAGELRASSPEGSEPLYWSAFAGHLSSGLKNYALAGSCIAIVLVGTGAATISDRVGAWIALHI